MLPMCISLCQKSQGKVTLILKDFTNLVHYITATKQTLLIIAAYTTLVFLHSIHLHSCTYPEAIQVKYLVQGNKSSILPGNRTYSH